MKPKSMRTTNILLLAGLFALAGCTFNPTACFEVEFKTRYIANDTIELTNCSIHSHSYLWTFPNGQTNTSENIRFTPLNSGMYTIELKVWDRRGNKSDKTTEFFKVYP